MRFMTPREYGSLLFMVFFKGRTLKRETAGLGKIRIIIQANLYNLVWAFIIITLIEASSYLIGFQFNFINAVKDIVVGIALGIVIGIAGGIKWGVLGGIGFVIGGITGGIGIGINIKSYIIISVIFIIVLIIILSITWGIVWGIVAGIIAGITSISACSIIGIIIGIILAVISVNIGLILMAILSGIIGSIPWGISWNIIGDNLGGVAASIIIGTILGTISSIICGVPFLIEGEVSWGFLLGITVGISFLSSYFIIWSRWFYMPVYLLAFLKKIDPKRLPSHWDENIYTPLPFLGSILLHISGYDRTAAIDEAVFLFRERPSQRRAAQHTLVQIAVKEMAQFRDLRNIACMQDELNFLPLDKAVFPEYYTKGYKVLPLFARDAQVVLDELNPSNRLRMLERLAHTLREFQKEMDFAKKKVGLPFGRIASRWLEIVQREINSLESDAGRPLPNPFITGRPVGPESEMFVGRRDIVEQIQQEALREGGGGAILFIGNRRTGKTSTLLNLKPLLLTGLNPVYVDCQETAISGNISYFCDTVVRSIGRALGYEEAHPEKTHLEEHSSLEGLTRFLQDLQGELRKREQYVLLCFDEYERLTEKITGGNFTGLPDAFRYWVQHLPRVICLFSGSHSLNEIRAIDWTDYLINVRTVPISFLDFDSALRLVTEPVPKFDLEYDPDLETARGLVRRLGCQPFLLQATMSELVNHLNTVKRKKATHADIDKAIEKLFIAWENYFEHIWKSETTALEKEALLAISQNRRVSQGSDTYIRSLIRKEVLRKEGDELAFCVPVFKEWLCKRQSEPEVK